MAWPDCLLTSVDVDWATIRKAFIKARGERKPTEIARTAKLHQSAVWKLENNYDLGPAVGTFVRAVEQGLGVRVSEFFRSIEDGTPSAIPGPQGKGAPDAAAVSPTSISQVTTNPDDLYRIGMAFLDLAAATRGSAKPAKPVRHAGSAKSGGHR